MDVNGDIRNLIAGQLTADLDLAFQLQLQEAINASLQSNDDVIPEEDSATIDEQLVLLLDEEVSSNKLLLNRETSHAVQLQDDVVPEEDGAAISLLGDEVSSYNLLLDHEASLAEQKRIQDELSRRIHDLQFAREIMNVPEDEWQSIGDHIAKPYGEGSSSSEASSSSDGSSDFIVYFKGLVSEAEEIVGGQRKVLSGIGIAVCDPNDVVVFEMSKGLMANENEAMNDEVAEVKALIEGLDVAQMLGLKRVKVCSNNSTIIRYVTRQLPPPEQGNLAALLKQASILGGKFTPCNWYHVEQDSFKFALKLARDAIEAQAGRPVTKGQVGMVETCEICLEDTYADQMFPVDVCLHRYCFSCMKKYAEVKLLQGALLPQCPHEGCKSEVKMERCRKFLSSELFHLMSQRLKEASIPPAEKIYCPYPRCSSLMSRAELQTFASSSHGEDSGARNCTKCHRGFCISCKVPWHRNLTCLDYKKQNPHASMEDAKLNSVANLNQWRQCPKCNHLISLSEGCYHIYCRCGHEFCYTCGAQWVNKKATCECPIWDERNIIRE